MQFFFYAYFMHIVFKARYAFLMRILCIFQIILCIFWNEYLKKKQTHPRGPGLGL
jgi:hypothetical protein